MRMRRLMPMLLLSLVAAPALAKPTGAHGLDGRSFRITIGEGAAKSTDRLTFAGGTLRASGDRKLGIGALPYTSSTEKRGSVTITSFNARGDHGREHVIWAGDVLEGTKQVTGTVRRWTGEQAP